MTCLFLVLLWAVPVRALGPTLEVAGWVFPPYSYVDSSGELRGEGVETVRQVLVAMGYQPKIVVMPFKRCLLTMQEGHMPLMLPCAFSSERSEYMEFSNPVFYINTVLWKKGEGLAGCWNDYGDLAGLRIGVGLGYSYGEEWDKAVARKNFSLEKTPGKSAELTHFRMAADGRIDMFISDLEVGRFLKAQHAPEFDLIFPCPKLIGEGRPFGMPISRKYFKEHNRSPEAFLERFNSILQTISPR